MPNTIKYSTSGDTLSLEKGNFFIGVGDVPKGPTSTTGHWQGITPPISGYTIYANKASEGPSIMVAENDTKLVEFTNGFSAQEFNYISNGGNFTDGTISPFNTSYNNAGGISQVVSIVDDLQYVGSKSKNSLYLNYNGGRMMGTTNLLTTGVTYTFSFWAKVISGTTMSITWNNQNGSGETNAWTSGTIITTQWARYSQTFVYNLPRTRFYFYGFNTSNPERVAIFTEFQVTTGSTYGGPGLQNSTEALRWFSAVPQDKICVNRDYEPIVTNGLVMNIDAGYTPSYGRDGTTCYDLAYSGFNCSLINGPTYSSINGGGLVCDGVDDYILQTSPTASTFSIEITYSPLAFNTNPGINRYNYVLSSFGSNIFLRYNTLNSGDSMLLANHSGSDINIGSLGHQINGIYNITITFDDSTKQTNVYLNGVLRTSTTYNATLRYIGSRQLGATFNSRFYSYKVYNRILSNSEVLQNYQSQLLKFLGQNVVMSEIVSYLDAGYYTSYPTSGTTWNNISGVNSGNGTLINGPTYSASNGGFLTFDGVDDYINLGNLSYNRTNFSVFAWINIPTNHVNWKSGILTKWNTGGSNGSNNEWFLGFDNQTGPSPFACTVQYGAGGSSVISVSDSVNYLTNTWYYVGFTWDKGNLKLYKNGNLVGSTSTINMSAQTTNQNVYVASFYSTPSSYGTNLKVGITQIYNKTINSSEVLQNYNSQKSRFGL